MAGAGGGAGAPDNFDDRKPADSAAGGVDLALPAAARLADAAASGRGVNGRRAAAIAAVAGGGDEGLNALLLTLTGGLTLAPTCPVFWHYLTSTVWRPLGPALVAQPVNWRGRHLIWYLLLFTISLWLQLGLPAELSRFTPFCLALPIIALARHYGWQGALIATLMNAIALIASQTWHDHPVDLLLSLLAQSLTGLLLGAGIQRLRAS